MRIKLGHWALPALPLCMLLLSGCQDSIAGGGNSPEQSPDRPAPVSISFWNPLGGGEGEFVEQIVDNFNASQSDIVVKQQRLESNEYYARLGTALSFGSGPDVAVAHAERLSPYVKAGQVLALDDLANRVSFSFDSINETNRQDVRFDGADYAVPLDTHFHMLYYNKDILSKAGLLNADGMPKLAEATTPDDFVQLLQLIRDRVPGTQPFAVNTPYFQETFLDLYYEAGGELLSPDGKTAAINNDKAVQVLKFFNRLFDEGLSDRNDKTPWDTFDSGRAGLWIGGTWEIGHYMNNPSLNVGLVPLPGFFGSSAHWGSSHTLILPSYLAEPKREAAMTFIKYFSEVGSALWGQAGHVPANREIFESSAYRELPYRDYMLESLETVKHAPKTDKYAALITSLSESLQSIIKNRIDPEAGLKEAENKLNQILAN
ncbi:ABC transporter substrate-binding protein [Cohnella thailandensis]|uniref:ABC transporter substrate-binding protein n=1 Tax=Cohnella thailandensis TaxID=557557 RepID=A0A841SWH0_9BACL|nr:ABC transporter substrate-binding protein [Cohnella thailandensis]MBB6634210.1 ABC transporter substrate-binding protein [Cohnella thailandensis]MBP1972292.1 multiple sugar transport system substrate-binding protein [Cohnella thailandensis]